MTFDEFCLAMFSLLEQDSVHVCETTSLKEELEVDSLQMVNFISCLADSFNIPFDHFIENANRLNTVGSLYEVVREGVE
ncbi:hypothetical protein PU629_20595 [Pullulanibacillus sp. KACC 23026]|uniref:hypothetical protein n=1 Tax=Pullulanibacillus sp. KACC 23026 TaxID=3028315 RepID=UPI0023AFF817|nr:hypothetical protein [Pullulanibacillus sp. KACC 23026]WEG12468.1 hypothetical protein PU629_20595 [Pullulanibacillus sp. KACC 23026]